MNSTNSDLSIEEIKKIINNHYLRINMIEYVTNVNNVITKQQIERYLETGNKILETALLTRMWKSEKFRQIGLEIPKLKFLYLKDTAKS